MSPRDVLEAVRESGPLGATVLQIASRTRGTPEAVARELEALAADGGVLRIGRGLWILRDFGDLGSDRSFVGPEEYAERFLRENGVALSRCD
ncbi:MAG: hypothetical protein QXG65_05815, partial [Thermoplasmata archaeon]